MALAFFYDALNPYGDARWLAQDWKLAIEAAANCGFGDARQMLRKAALVDKYRFRLLALETKAPVGAGGFHEERLDLRQRNFQHDVKCRIECPEAIRTHEELGSMPVSGGIDILSAVYGD